MRSLPVILLAWVDLFAGHALAAGTSLPAPVFDVQSYGAKGDGATYDTKAIQQAIDACAGTGGSVTLAHGTFLTAALEVKGKMTFHVASDAVLPGGLEPEDYPERVPYTTNESAGSIWNRRSLLYANQADGLRLEGGGVIDGQGKEVKTSGVGGHMSRNAGNRPSILRIYQSKGVVVRILSVPPAYEFYVRHADKVKFESIRIGFLKDDVRKWPVSEDAAVETTNCMDRRLIARDASTENAP